MIHQGHPYRLGDVKVIALQDCPADAQAVRVAIPHDYGFNVHEARAEWLEALPSRYLGGSNAE